MKPNYNIDKIKFAVDAGTWERAVKLYEQGRVTDFEEDSIGFSATVLGGSPYGVYVHASDYARGNCACYLGQNDRLCKHMVAVAIHALEGGKPLTEEDKTLHDEIVCSGRVEVLSLAELERVKKLITSALRYIKPYRGSSRTWFAYQDSLFEGCNRLASIVSDLPVSLQTATILVKLVLRLDKKLWGAVDDSDGVVGGCIQEIVSVIEEYIKIDPTCIEALLQLKGKSTIFDWEEPLLRILDQRK